MPKKTDTRDKVHEAADTLLASGQRPTQQAVRDLIGTGSITTINLALNDWWMSLAKRVNRQSEHPALPEPVITAASKLWDQALAYSHASLEQERKKLNVALEQRKLEQGSQLSETQSTLAFVQEQNNKLLAANQLANEQKNSLQNRINELESSIIQLNGQNSELIRQNKQQEIVINQSDYRSDNHHVSAEFLQAKIDLKVNESIIADLKQALTHKENQNERLQQQLFDHEKNGIRQVHRLEMVIAQQDLKYNSVKEELDYFKKTYQ